MAKAAPIEPAWIFAIATGLEHGDLFPGAGRQRTGESLLHIFESRKEQMFNPDLHRLEIQALTNFFCPNKIEILTVAGPRESKEPGVYKWTLAMLRRFFNQTASGAGFTETAGE